MGMSEFYGAPSDAESIAHPASRARAAASSSSTPRTSTARYTNEELRRARARGQARRRPSRHQVRLRARSGEPASARHRRPPGARAGGLRGEPAAPRRRAHRSVLPAPRRPAACRSRRRSARWRSWCSAGKVRYLGLSEVSPADARARPPRAPDHRAAERVFAVDARPGGRACSRPASGSASASCPTARSGAAFSPARSRAPRTSTADDYRRTSPRFQGENFARNLALVEQGEDARPARRAARRRSSRSPGCWRRASTSCRFPARAAAAISTKTSARSRCSSRPADLAAIEAVFPAGVTAGARYGEAMMRYLRVSRSRAS